MRGLPEQRRRAYPMATARPRSKLRRQRSNACPSDNTRRSEGLDEFNEFVYGLSGQEISEDDLTQFLASAGMVDDPADARAHPAWDQWVPHRAALSWLGQGLAEAGHSIEDLTSIACPVLRTQGTTTKPWAKRVVEVLADHLTDATVVEFDGGHAHHIQSIDAFTEQLEAHLHADAT